MARKQVGMIDEGLLDRVDEHASELGQTRRVYVERALQTALAMRGVSETAERATENLVATHETLERLGVRSDVVGVREPPPIRSRRAAASSRVKADVVPIPKRGK